MRLSYAIMSCKSRLINSCKEPWWLYINTIWSENNLIAKKLCFWWTNDLWEHIKEEKMDTPTRVQDMGSTSLARAVSTPQVRF
jgi:hypothetical protein